MKILGNPGPDCITVTFEDGEFCGKSVTMKAEPVVGGIVLYSSTFNSWDGQQDNIIDVQTKKRIVEMIQEELKKHPSSEIVE